MTMLGKIRRRFVRPTWLPDPHYRRAPLESADMPPGIPQIVGNEGCERYSFYGMRAILVIFMTKFMMDASGMPDFMSEEEAKVIFHEFNALVYVLPIFGAILSDWLLGKYYTIMILSFVYCAGHGWLAFDNTREGLGIGLMLIAIGSGGIKPNVSAHVGDQFCSKNEEIRNKVFNYFYVAINVGAGASILVTPWVLQNHGPEWAFAIPGVLMGMATVIFWSGRKKFAHIPPGGKAFVREVFSLEFIVIALKLACIFVPVAMFWALFDQGGSAWVLQAEKMNLNFLGIEWLSSQVQVINPLLIVVLVVIFSGWEKVGWRGLYHYIDNHVVRLTPLRKIGAGFFVTVPSFLIVAYVEKEIAAGALPSIGWHVLAYVFITTAEVLVSITCLDFAYSQAPKTMKSMVLALFLMSVSLGNIFTARVNEEIQNPTPAFVPDAPGEYVVQLEASDGVNTTTGTATILVRSKYFELSTEEKEAAEAKRKEAQAKKKPLKADAGKMMAVMPGEQTRLYGTSKTGDTRTWFMEPFEYSWIVSKTPAGSAVTDADLKDSDTRNPTFTPDVEGDYEVTFVSKIGGAEARSTVTIRCTNENLPPIVSIDAPAEVRVMEKIELSGAASYDPNGDRLGDHLTYKWRFMKVPEGTSIVDDDITGSSYAKPTSKLEGPWYALFFALCILCAGVLFIPIAVFYRERSYLQGAAVGPK